MACPNIHSPQWQELVGKIGIYEAFKEFVRHGEQVPDPNNYTPIVQGVNYGLQIVNALLQPPVEGWFQRFYKTEKRPEVFFRKLLSTRTPKEQIDILQEWMKENNPATLNDAITGIISEMSFTIKAQVAVTNENIVTPSDMTLEQFDALPVPVKRASDTNEFLDIDIESKEYEGKRYTVQVVEGQRSDRVYVTYPEHSPSQTYSFLTAPGYYVRY